MKNINNFSQIFQFFWRHRTAILVPFHLLEGSKLSIVHNALQILR